MKSKNKNGFIDVEAIIITILVSFLIVSTGLIVKKHITSLHKREVIQFLVNNHFAHYEVCKTNGNVQLVFVSTNEVVDIPSWLK